MDELLTWHGITSVLGPLIPFLLLIEIIRGAFYNRFKVIHYKNFIFYLCAQCFYWQGDIFCNGGIVHRLICEARHI